jgi:hypothetical protein
LKPVGWVIDNTVTGSGSIFEKGKGLIMPKDHSQFTTVPVNSIEVSDAKKGSKIDQRLNKAKNLVKGDGHSMFLGLSDQGI